MMRRRHPDGPPSYSPDPQFERTLRYRRAVNELTGNQGERLNAMLTPRERLLVRVDATALRYPSLDKRKFGEQLARAAAEVRQVCVAPRMNEPTSDLMATWSQPEAARLWKDWWHPSIGQAYAAAYEGTKGVMITVAGLKRGPHILAGHDALTASPPLMEFFGELASAAGRGVSGKPPLVVREYSASTRHLKRLSDGFPELAQNTAIAVLRALADLHPEAPIGHYITIDGTDVPAWCPQRSAKRNGVLDEQIEARFRKRVPDAAFRAIGYDGDGQFDPETEPRRKGGGRGKSWRGYRLVVATDLVTGLPLAGTLFGADAHEPHSASIILDRLHDAWPDIPLRAIVADKLWDDNRTHRLLETNYGIHLVADRQPSHITKGGKVFAPLDTYRGGISRIAGDGVAYCRTCGGALRFDGTDPARRSGFASGEATTARFRARFTCKNGCGRMSVPTDLAWSALPHYPLNPLGRSDLYAYRIALLAQRNVAESVFSSLKGAFAQGLSGGRRTRVFDRGVYESLIWLSLLTRGLLTIADQRLAHLGKAALAA